MELKRTKRNVAKRITIHGAGGVGKSTFAAAAPKPVFITSEDGLINIDAVCVEPIPKTWEDTLAAVDFVAKSDRQTLVIDSLDWLEPLCWDYVCRKAKSPKIKSIEDFGYGKGYLAALDEWRVLIHRLSALRVPGINVILIAHSLAKVFRNPEGDDFDRWQLKLNEKAAGLISEWSDVVGFAQVEVSTYEVSPGQVGTRSKALSTGNRVLRTDKCGAFEAKSRYDIPASIPLEWPEFLAAIQPTKEKAK